MIYYFEILEIIQKAQGREMSGVEIQTRFFQKYKAGSVIGINKTLKKLRKRSDIKAREVPPNVFYKYKKQN